MTKVEQKAVGCSMPIQQPVDLEGQLEWVDEDENQIERFFKRDQLLEEQDWLIDQSDETSTTEESQES